MNDIYQEIIQRDLLNSNIKKHMESSEFFSTFLKFVTLEEYDFFSDLIGKFIVIPHSCSPVTLDDIIIPKCYDNNFLKRNGRMIRLCLTVRWSYEYQDDNYNLSSYFLDVPYKLIENFSIKKFKKWAETYTLEIREKEIESIESEINELKNKLIKLKGNYEKTKNK